MSKKLSPAQIAMLAKLYSGQRVRWHESKTLGNYAGRMLTPGLFRMRDDSAHVGCALALLKRGLIKEESRDDYGPICCISEAGRQAYVTQVSP